MSIQANNTTLYTLKDLSAMLHITERTLYNYLHDGKMRGQIIGRKWYVSQENLDAFINGVSR